MVALRPHVRERHGHLRPGSRLGRRTSPARASPTRRPCSSPPRSCSARASASAPRRRRSSAPSLEAIGDGVRTPDLVVTGAAATTRQFMDVLLAGLPLGTDADSTGVRRMKMLGSDAILRSLEAEGVDIAFGIPGGAILPIYDAFARGTSVRHVLARHEQGAGHMAEGYARASGRVGVAFATSGPGATNLVTPIADAWMDSTPLVCITGQVRTHLIGTDAFQECDIIGITLPIVKHSWLVQDVEELPDVLKAAFHVARTGRCGPVLVDIPRDVQEAELDFRYPDDGRPARLEAAAAACTRARSQRPPRRSRPPRSPSSTSAAGRSTPTPARSSASSPRSGGFPVVTTLMAKGAFPETHQLHFGWPGMHGSEVVELGDEQVRPPRRRRRALRRPRHRQARRVRAGRDGRPPRHRLRGDRRSSASADIPVVGPLKQVLADLADELRGLHAYRPAPRTEPWLRQLDAWREEFPLRYGDDGDRSSRSGCSSRCRSSPPGATT